MPFSWVTTGSHASRTVARRLLWCVPDHKMLWINPLASALCREMPRTPAMAFIALLVWGSYNKTSISLPAAFLRKTASRCWRAQASPQLPWGRGLKLVLGVLVCLACPVACCAYWGTLQPMGKDLLLFRDVCTYPVQAVHAGDWTRAANPGPSASHYTLPNRNGSTAVPEVTSAPMTTPVSGDGCKGWLI